MRRLFGMTTAGPRVPAWFRLLEASSSIAKQSHDIPDGTSDVVGAQAPAPHPAEARS
jgi:hypothetical protein